MSHIPFVVPALPQESGLDTRALSETLTNKSSAYKFLWMLALLDCLPPSEKAQRFIATQKITLRMLRLADVPIRRYCLFFGLWDRAKEKFSYLSNQEEKIGGNIFEKFSDDEILRFASPECEKINEDFMEFAPYLWLTPFFKAQGKVLPRRSEARVSKIAELDEEYFDNEPPLPYCFRDNEKFLEMHPRWLLYFVRNREIIRSWVLPRWIDYLQAQNPNTPAIAAKIADPKQQTQLKNESEWWRGVLGVIGEAHCIYSGEKIARDRFALDHFLPWCLVGHNRLWNLIPVSVNAHKSKGDSLPYLGKYFSPFVEMQQRALGVYVANPGRFARQREIADAYVSDLHIPISPPPTYDALATAYHNGIFALASLARNRGFACDWQYRRQ